MPRIVGFVLFVFLIRKSNPIKQSRIMEVVSVHLCHKNSFLTLISLSPLYLPLSLSTLDSRFKQKDHRHTR